MIHSFKDGSGTREELVKLKAGPRQRQVFAVRDSGGWYAIDLQGNLKMYDEDGLIREAKTAR